MITKILICFAYEGVLSPTAPLTVRHSSHTLTNSKNNGHSRIECVSLYNIYIYYMYIILCYNSSTQPLG